jgi:hypothetical protein
MTPRTLVHLAWIYRQAAQHRCEVEGDGATCEACQLLEESRLRRARVKRAMETT